MRHSIAVAVSANSPLDASPRHGEWVDVAVAGGTDALGSRDDVVEAIRGLTAGELGAGHGFLRAQAGREGANLAAAQKAWPTTVAFLGAHLGG